MIDVLLFLFVWLGDACLWLFLLNVLYSQPYDRTFLKLFRLFAGGIIFLLPPLFMLIDSTAITTILQQAGEFHHRIPLALYIVACLFISAILLPVITIARLRKQNPSQVLNEVTETVDIEKELGYRPIGDGKHARQLSHSWNQFFTVDFTTLTLQLPNLPASWEGLTILHLSDLHFVGSPGKEYFERVFQKCMADGIPDLVVISGDIIDTKTHHEWMAPLLGRLKWKIAAFAILGNHDWWYDYDQVRHILKELHFHEVGNKWETILIHGEPLHVIGHEGPWFQPAPDLKDCPQLGFRLCLSHTPDNINWGRRHHIDLMLSGHNHGGQIRLPIFGSLFVPSKYGRRFDMGTFFRSPTLLHVNRGLGGKEPIRFRCNPQVTRLILGNAECGMPPLRIADCGLRNKDEEGGVIG